MNRAFSGARAELAMLAQWIGPGASWHNKFGETLTLDDLVLALLDRATWDAGSCNGLHVFGTCCIIWRLAVERGDTLRPETLRTLEQYVRDTLDAIWVTQHADGHWDASWKGHRTARPASAADDLVSTGHVLEALTWLPERVPVDSRTVLRGVRWLAQRLQDTKAIDPRLLCPYTHAVVALGRTERRQ